MTSHKSVMISRCSTRLVRPLLLALAGVLPGPIPSAFAGGPNSNGNSGVMPVQAQFHGRSYSEWAVRWWQWVARTDTPSSPFLNPTDNFAVGQSGPVWNLVAWGANPVLAEGTIPEGTALFFPASTFNDFGEFGISPEQAFQIIQNPGGEVDGAAIDDADSYAAVTPAFMLTFTGDNFFGLFPGDYGPVVASGYFFLVRPLSSGTHTVHFYFDLINVPWADHYEVFYKITVIPSRNK